MLSFISYWYYFDSGAVASKIMSKYGWEAGQGENGDFVVATVKICMCEFLAAVIRPIDAYL